MKQYRVRREEDLWNVMPISKGCYGKIKWEAGPKKGARQGGEKTEECAIIGGRIFLEERKNSKFQILRSQTQLGLINNRFKEKLIDKHRKSCFYGVVEIDWDELTFCCCFYFVSKLRNVNIFKY